MSEPVAVIEGIEDVIVRDLAKHKEELARTRVEVREFRKARRHEWRKRLAYRQHLKEGKFNRVRMEASIVDIGINIKHFEGRVKACEAHIVFEENIVATLTEQLATQNKALEMLAKYRREHGPGH